MVGSASFRTGTLDKAQELADIPLEQFDQLAQAAQSHLQHRVGDIRVDKIIAFGYLKVNSGRLEEAIEIFTSLLRSHSTLLAAYLGRGTALALGGKLDLVRTRS